MLFRSGDILDLSVDAGVVNKSGAWFAYEGNKIGQGRENAKTYLKENPVICDEIEKRVREFYHLDNDVVKEEVSTKKASKKADES